MSEVYFVLAGSYEQALNFANKKKIRPATLIYVDEPYKLYGHRDETLWLTGTYWKNKEHMILIEIAQSRGFEIKKEY